VTESFADKLKRLELELEAQGKVLPPRTKVAKPPAQSHDPDLIPDVSPEQRPLDNFLDSIDILDAYDRWCGKSMP